MPFNCNKSILSVNRIQNKTDIHEQSTSNQEKQVGNDQLQPDSHCECAFISMYFIDKKFKICIIPEI